jgi:hypothetical protein
MKFLALVRHTLVLTLAVACSKAKHAEPRVFVLNGLDIPVAVSIESESGKASFVVAARGLATPDVTGSSTVKVTTTKGALISESAAEFGAPAAPGCYPIYSVLGAAAYVNEDVGYGTGGGKPAFDRRAGEIIEDECGISFAFVDPPNAIRVKRQEPSHEDRGWLHYEGDGGWVTAVSTLLDDTSEWASQSRGKAYMILTAVVTHDPTNPALPALEQRLTRLGIAIPTPTEGNLLAPPRRRHS